MDIIQQFELYLTNDDKSKNTIKSYMKIIRSFDDWLKTTYAIPDISIIQFREIKHYREDLLKRYAPSSVNQTISCIKTFFHYLKDIQAITVNPAEKVKLQKIEEHFEHKYLSRVEELAILRESQEKGIMQHCLLLLMLKTGIRCSEASDLTLNCITLEKDPTLLIKDSKGQKSRYIPLTTDIVEILKKWIEERNKSEKIFHRRSDYVFFSQRSSKLSSRGIQKKLEKIGDSSNPKVHLHPIRLRSTFAFNLIETGAPLTVVQSLLGHSTMEMVSRYAKPSFELKRKYMEQT
jgi:site-specific recombinase XerD